MRKRWWIREVPLPLFMISVWNVRGMNASLKQRDVANFVHTNKVSLMGFVETKLTNSNILTCHKKFYSSWHTLDNCDLHPRGRLWIIWREEDFEIIPRIKDSSFIQMEVVYKKLACQFTLTIVYAPNDFAARVEL